MEFLTEDAPVRGNVLPVLPGIARIVAPNPGPMTYHGTNTYLIEGDDGFSVLDPGPDNAAHVQAILAATGGRIARILLSHTHLDHLGAVPALKAATGVPAYGYHTPSVPHFSPDIPLHDNDVVAGWTALHTPGHAADHLAFARDGVVFTADHVMSWSSSVVSPPDGDMTAYFASLHRLLARSDDVFLPGHGPPITAPRDFAQGLLEHRTTRETMILKALSDTPKTAAALVPRIYGPIDPRLVGAAARNVTAHLHKLRNECRAEEADGGWRVRTTNG